VERRRRRINYNDNFVRLIAGNNRESQILTPSPAQGFGIMAENLLQGQAEKPDLHGTIDFSNAGFKSKAE
jgi:ATP phosphoribosyltransferase regulatory subunit HisZ